MINLLYEERDLYGTIGRHNTKVKISTEELLAVAKAIEDMNWYDDEY